MRIMQIISLIIGLTLSFSSYSITPCTGGGNNCWGPQGTCPTGQHCVNDPYIGQKCYTSNPGFLSCNQGKAVKAK